MERQPSGASRGGAVRERLAAANGARGRGRRNCTRLCTCGCGAEGRGGAERGGAGSGLGLAIPGLLCCLADSARGKGTGTWVPSQRSSHAPREVSGGQAGPKLPCSSGCQVAH